ncbi:hypothetical protein Tsubulata_013229, partial [Turnera subulata]
RCQDIRSIQLGRCKNLSSLEVIKCPLFESLVCGDEEGPLNSLQYLMIFNCNNFISFPGQGLQAPNLRKLSLEFLDALEELPKHMHSLLPSLTALTLYRCTKLRTFSEGGLPSSLQYLELVGCHKTLEERCQENGEDWHKISHIPRIRTNYLFFLTFSK